MTTSVSFSSKNSVPFTLFNSHHHTAQLQTPIARPNSLTPIVFMNSTSEYYNTSPEKSTPINSPLSKLSPISHSPSFIKTPYRFVSHDRTNSRASTKSVEKMDISQIINSPSIKPSPSNFYLNKSPSKKRIIRIESDQSTLQTPHSSAISNLKKSLPTPKAAPLTDSYLQNNSTPNNKKYQFRINKPTHLSFSKGSGNFVDPDIEMIKRNVKIQGKRTLKLVGESKEALNEMKEINITKKKGQVLTAEEEKQVKLLRKKVEISNIFESKVMNDEEKKLAYRQLILEFHPDKTRHDIEFSLGVFYFLQVNKERFVGGGSEK